MCFLLIFLQRCQGYTPQGISFHAKSAKFFAEGAKVVGWNLRPAVGILSLKYLFVDSWIRGFADLPIFKFADLQICKFAIITNSVIIEGRRLGPTPSGEGRRLEPTPNGAILYNNY